MRLQSYRPVPPTRCNESPYKVSCPSCGAPPGRLCASRRSGRTLVGPQGYYAHRKRRPVDRERLPKLGRWWRAVAPWEGQHKKPRRSLPASLAVPS